MRSSILCCAALAAGLLASAPARACDPVTTECLPALTVFPAFTHEGVRVGTVVAAVEPRLPIERSRFTGQPQTVVYNNPGSLPGSVDCDVVLMPLPRARHFHTRAVYPRGS